MFPETLSEHLSLARARVDQAAELLSRPSLAATLRCDRVLFEAVADLRRCEMMLRSEDRTPDTALALDVAELGRSVGRLKTLLDNSTSLCQELSDILALHFGGYGRTGHPAVPSVRRSLSVEY